MTHSSQMLWLYHKILERRNLGVLKNTEQILYDRNNSYEIFMNGYQARKKMNLIKYSTW